MISEETWDYWRTFLLDFSGAPILENRMKGSGFIFDDIDGLSNVCHRIV